MLFKLSLKNIKKSFKDYAIYFLTLVLGVAIFYVFNAMDSQQAMLELNDAEKEIIGLMNEFLGGVSIFVAIVLGFLIIYASRFLIKRRKKEFGIYLTLGMGKRDVSKILLMETFIIGIISLVAGLIIGIIASQFMSIVVANLFEADMSEFTFVFSKAAAIKTIFYYVIIYLIVMIFNVFAVTKYKLIDLLNASKKGEKIKVRSLGLSVVIFLIAAVILGIAYYFATQRLDSLDLFGTSILLGIIGTFLLFFGISGFILKLVQSNKKLYLKNLNIFILRQINSKVNTTVFSMSIICLLLFFTITIFSSAWSINMSLKNDLRYGTPADVLVYTYSDAEGKTAKNILTKVGYNLDNFAEYTESYTYGFDTVTVGSLLTPILNDVQKDYPNLLVDNWLPVMTISDYNKIASFYGNQTYTLNEDEFILVADYEQMLQYENKALAKGVTIQIGDKTLHNKYKECVEGLLQMSGNKSNTGIVVVPDNIDISLSEITKNFLAANFKGDKDEANSELMSYMDEINGEGAVADTKIDIYTASTGLRAIMIFIGLYLGIIFLISSAAILALKELSDSSDNKEKYGMLRRIGVDDKKLNKALFIQIGIFFMLPLLVAIIHSVFGIMSASKIMESMSVTTNISSIAMTALLIIAIYGGYFIVTYFTSKRIINEKSE
mgnify:FL=1